MGGRATAVNAQPVSAGQHPLPAMAPAPRSFPLRLPEGLTWAPAARCATGLMCGEMTVCSSPGSLTLGLKVTAV